MNFSYFLTVTALALTAISANAQVPVFTNAAPPSPIGVNVPFSFQYTASGPTSTFALTPGSQPLPTGLTLTSAGLLSGTPTLVPPTSSSTYTGSVTATNSSGTAAQNFSILVEPVLNTVPEGVVTYTINSGVNYFGVPLSNDPVYSDAVSSVTNNTISVANTSAFTGTLANLELPTSSVPYFVKFLTGLQAGRVLLVTGNTASTLTVDITDHSSQSVALNASGFAVNATTANGGPDTFEIFAGETLASMFGTGTSLVLASGTSSLSADVVGLYSSTLSRFVAYYYNSTAGTWEQSGSSANANSIIIYPHTCFEITRRSSSTSFSIMGRVPEVSNLIKTTGLGANVYNSSTYPVDMTLSQLKLGATGTPWVQAGTFLSADSVAVYNSTHFGFDAYYQYTDGTWRKAGGGAADKSNFVIKAGTTVVFIKRGSVSGTSSYIVPVIPYSTN